MTRLAGYVFDTYDDLDGRVLRSIAPSPDDLPVFVKTAARLTEEQIETGSDDRFALVLVDQGHKLKKYATVDKGNTALSVMYLLKQAHLLPPLAVKIAASNLIGACKRHGLDVPMQLKLAAKSGLSTVGGKAHTAYAKGAKVTQIPFTAPNGPKESTDNPQLGLQDGGRDDVEKRVNFEGIQGENVLSISPTDKEKIKTAGAFGDAEGDTVVKQKSWRQSPYVDMNGWDPAAAEAFEAKPAELTLLEGNYQVDGYDQVKTAGAYFEENWRQFHPRQRHEYCVKLAQRSEQLGIKIAEDVARYGSETYAADVDAYVEARRSYAKEEYHPALDLLLEKRAQVTPGTFAEALSDFDDISGLRWHWDAQVADPWMSTFGPSLEKVAAADWSWASEDGYIIDEDYLKELALNHKPELVAQMGEYFVEGFAKSPKSVFESLPLPNKKVIAHMCSQMIEGI